MCLAASMNKGRTVRGVSETAEKLSNMSIGTRRQSMGQNRPSPAMKAGVNYISESGNFVLRSGQQNPTTERRFTRKVAGWVDFWESSIDQFFKLCQCWMIC